MKRILPFLLGLSMVVTLAACGGGTGKAEGGSTDTVHVVAFLMPHLDNPFMNRLSDSVKKYAKDAGLELVSYVANNDVARQSAQIAEAVSAGVSAIILDPCSNDALADAVAKAKAAGVPVVTLHEGISTQSDCAAFVGPDFTGGGRQAMERAMRDLPGGGNIAIIYGMEGHSAQIAISAGYPLALEGQTAKYPVVAEGYGNWAAEDAKALTAAWLSGGRAIDAIVCNNDGMATGVLEAVTEAGLVGQIHIYGLDAQPNILDAIKSGDVMATIYTDFDGEAQKSVEIVTDILGGKVVSAEYMLSMILITADNVDDYRQ